jgi:hypothetical protein
VSRRRDPVNEGRKGDLARAWRGVQAEIRRRTASYALTGCGALLLVVGTMVQLFRWPLHRATTLAIAAMSYVFARSFPW